DVDVLLHQDVAGEHAVEHPVAHARLHRGHAGRGLPREVARVVVGLRADDVADVPGVAAPHHLPVGRRVAAVEPHRHADLARPLRCAGVSKRPRGPARRSSKRRGTAPTPAPAFTRSRATALPRPPQPMMPSAMASLAGEPKTDPGLTKTTPAAATAEALMK